MKVKWIGLLVVQLLCHCLIAKENFTGENMDRATEKEMKRESITKPEIKLVGICVRTSYKQELEKMKGNIFPCVQRYFHGALFEKIPNRVKPGTTFCVYTDYESDYMGDYTYSLEKKFHRLHPLYLKNFSS